MGIVEAVKGVYFNMEEHWYNTLDVIDKKVPIYPLVDRVDAIIPSFLLFLLIIILILIPLLFVFGKSVLPEPYISGTEATILVTSNGIPVSGVEISLESDCYIHFSDSPGTGITDEAGKTKIIICGEGTYTIRASKSGYQPFEEEINLQAGRQTSLSLEPVSLDSTRYYYADVTDMEGDPIQDVLLEMICADNQEKEQIILADGEFRFVPFKNCSTIQLTASAKDYDLKTIIFRGESDRIQIKLYPTASGGTVAFETTSGGDLKEGIEITLTDRLQRTYTIFSDTDGIALFENIPSEEYSYIVYDSETGETKTGSFLLAAGEIKNIIADLPGPDDPNEPGGVGAKNRIIIKVVDEAGSFMVGAQTKIYMDGNLLTSSKYTNNLGELSIVVSLDKTYSIIVDKVGYAIAFERVELKAKGDSPQLITLLQTSGTIRVRVESEKGTAVRNAAVILEYIDLDGPSLNADTDSNGWIEFDRLLAGDYFITARTDSSHGEESVSLGVDETQEIIITLVIGKGKIQYSLADIYGSKINVNSYSVLSEEKEGYIVSSDGESQRYYIGTDDFLHGTNIKLLITDKNYFPYEEIPYSIESGTTKKRELFLRTKNDLPNDNVTQIFLQKIYKTNPITTDASSAGASKLEAGNRYYLLFHAILNPNIEFSDDLVANFVVGPKNETDLNDTIFSIDGVYSIDGSLGVLSETYSGFEINYTDSLAITNENAKQANLRAEDIRGPKEVPIVLVMDIAEGAEGIEELHYEIIWGEQSLTYSKEFEIGKTFCVSDCPTFLYSNYISWESEEFEPLSDDEAYEMYLGDNYELNTVVENLSDNDFGEVELRTLHTSSSPKILFGENEADSFTQAFSLGPFTNYETEPTSAKPNESSSYLKIMQIISKYSGNTDLLEDYEGVENEFRVKILSKDQLKIETSPTEIHAGSEYALFVIEITNDTQKVGLPAYWRVEKEGVSGLFNGMTGQTDSNGLAVIPLDATNLETGDKLIFTGYKSGFLDATIEIEVKEITLIDREPLLACIESETEIIRLNVGATGSFNLKSVCDERKEIFIETDQFVNPKQFSMLPGEEITVTVQGTAKEDVLGAYPLKVITIENGEYTVMQKMDVIVSDPNNCFQLGQAIYDLTEDNEIRSTVTNNCFNGRPDIYYPQITSSTNSIGLAYEHHDVPETITFTAKVIGVGVESAVFCYIKSDEIYASNRDGTEDYPWERPINTPISADGASFTSEAQEVCTEFMTAFAAGTDINDDVAVNTRSTARGTNAPPTSITSGKEGTLDNIEPDDLEGEYEAIISLLRKDENLDQISWFSIPNALSTLQDWINYGLVAGVTNPQDATLDGWALYPYTGNTAFPYSMYYFPRVTPAHTLPCPANDGSCYFMMRYHWDSTHDVYGNPTPGVAELYANLTNIITSEATLEDTYDEESEDETTGGGSIWSATIDRYGFVKYEVTNSARCDTARCQLIDGGYLGKDTNFTFDNNSEQSSSGSAEDGSAEITGIAEDVNANPSGSYISLKVQGYENEGEWYEFDGDTHYTAVVDIQFDELRLVEFLRERKNVWEEEVSFTPAEDTNATLGAYEGEAVPAPEWMGTQPAFGFSGASKIDGAYSAYTPIVSTGRGFINPIRATMIPPAEDSPYCADEDDVNCETVTGETVSVQPLDGASWQYGIHSDSYPLVEYVDNFMYYIPEESIPEGLEMWLEDGDIKAKYIGIQEDEEEEGGDEWETPLTDGTIGMTITVDNIRGEEYAIITVKDWVYGTEIREQKFQIKLIGRESNCGEQGGKTGLTGKEFTPRLLFDWDWEDITKDQCDYKNDDYTYCDATQFTVSLFKRLKEVEDYLESGRKNELGTLANFHAYLIKDNYRGNFLDDFDEFYSGEIAGVDLWFNSSGSNRGYDKFIDEDRITFEGGDLSQGGLYLVSLGIEFDDKTVDSLFSQGQPNATINVRFRPVAQAPNYNPFYETPFDGEVGLKGTVTRTGYGTSIDGQDLKLNETTNARSYSGASSNIVHGTTRNLSILDSGVVLNFNNTTRTLSLNPSQPTPVIVKITGNGRVVAQYEISGEGASTAPAKTWVMKGSSIGNEACMDFEGNNKLVFTETKSGNTRTLSWNGSKKGIIELGTVFLTPKSSNNVIAPLQSGSSIQFNSKPSLLNAEAVMLNSYDSSVVSDYDTLQGVFNMLDEELICMSQDSEEVMELWWNPEYLNEELSALGTETASCG